jgi:hypothetical protein
MAPGTGNEAESNPFAPRRGGPPTRGGPPGRGAARGRGAPRFIAPMP